MRFVMLAAVAVLISAPALAAEPTPQPKPDQTFSPILTSEDINIINTALEVSATYCQQNRDACVVGFNKAAIEAKLNASMQPAKK